MWDDAQLNINAAKMQHQKLLHEAEQRRMLKAVRQYQSGGKDSNLRAHVAQLWVTLGRLIAPNAPQTEDRRVPANL